MSLAANCINLMAGQRAPSRLAVTLAQITRVVVRVRQGRGRRPIYEIVTRPRGKKLKCMRGIHHPKQFPYYANIVQPIKGSEVMVVCQRGHGLHW